MIRRRLLRTAGLLGLGLALVATPFLWHGYRYATLDDAYREHLESEVQRNPSDSEAWFALGTCSSQPPDFFATPPMNLESVDRAIALDPRPAYLLIRYEITLCPETLERLLALEPDNALVWIYSAALYREASRSLTDALRALSCIRVDDHGREGIQIHRRFIRCRFGEGYFADSLMLRNEWSAGIRWEDFWHFRRILRKEVERLRESQHSDEAERMLIAMHRIGMALFRTGSTTAAQSCGYEIAHDAVHALCTMLHDLDRPEEAAWNEVKRCLGRLRFGICGNAYAGGDPWIVRNSWPGRFFYFEETFCGTWLPLWYWVHQEELHGVAENLGKPGNLPWREADKDLFRLEASE